MGKCLSSSSFSSGAFFLWDWKNNTITCTSREVSHDSNFRGKTTTTGTCVGKGSYSSNNNNSSRDPLHQAESKKYLGLRRKEIIRPKFSLVSPFHYYFFRWIFFLLLLRISSCSISSYRQRMICGELWNIPWGLHINSLPFLPGQSR